MARSNKGHREASNEKRIKRRFIEEPYDPGKKFSTKAEAKVWELGHRGYKLRRCFYDDFKSRVIIEMVK